MSEAEHRAHGVGGAATVSTASIEDYIALMRIFLNDQISASVFERRYLELFQADETERPEPTFRVLNDLFFDVDAFRPDPALRDAYDLDEEQLPASVRAAVQALTA